MSHDARPYVLLLSADPRERRRWAAVLEPATARIWNTPDEFFSAASAERRIDLIVTDGEERFDADTRFADWAVDDLGVVRLGGTDSVDLGFALRERVEASAGSAWTEVALPLDASARELLLVCRLLGEIVALRRAVRSSQRQRAALAVLAQTDALTGLANRRAWEEALSQRVAAARRAAAIVLIDLDHFKQVNERLGHDSGDAVLRAAAVAIAQSVRRDDLAARIGGDEFAVLLSGVDSATAMAIVERIRARIAHETSNAADGPVTGSAGYALLGANSEEATDSELINQASAAFAAADAALRKAKHTGRDRAIAAPIEQET